MLKSLRWQKLSGWQAPSPPTSSSLVSGQPCLSGRGGRALDRWEGPVPFACQAHVWVQWGGPGRCVDAQAPALVCRLGSSL